MKIPLKDFKIVLVINFIASISIYLLRDTLIFPYILQIVLILLGVGVFYLLQKKVGLKKSILLFLLIGTYGLLIEAISIKTGFPYSKFVYSNLMGYKVSDIVPYSVFLIWPTLVISAYSLSEVFIKRGLYKILVTIGLLVLLDLVFDPVATKIGFWVWENPGMYYGVPYMNFVGWVVSSAISSLLVYTILRDITLKDRYLVLVYLGNLLLWTFLSVKLSLYLPVLISMGIFIILFKKYRLVD